MDELKENAMEAIRRLLREYNILSAAISATIGFLLLMGWVELTQEQMGGLLALIAAWFAVLRFIVTPVASPNLPSGTVVNKTSSTPTVIE